MDAREKFIIECEISKRNAAQISALDMLTKAAELNDTVLGVLLKSDLQPVIILGVLESIRAQIIHETRKMLPENRT